MARTLHALGILIAGSSLLATPALAEVARTSLGVSAIVLPACQVSAAPDAGTAEVACSHLGGGSVAIRRGDSHFPVERRELAPTRTGGTPASNGVTHVTVTY